MKSFSASCVLLAVAVSADGHANKKSYTGGVLTNGDKSVTAASYTNWKLEGTGESQTMTQWMVQTLTWGKADEVLSAGDELQVYNAWQSATDKSAITVDLWKFIKSNNDSI